MIDWSILPLFFTAIFFLAISPGPDLILISTYSSTKSFKAGLMIALGIFAAGVLQTLLVALGLGQLMQSVPVLTYLVKAIGALYLTYLGVKLLRNWWLNNSQTDEIHTAKSATNAQLVLRGFLNNLLNPKALLFFSLFLPQFTSGQHMLSQQILILGCLLSVFVLMINSIFAFCFSALGQWAGSKLKLGRHIDGMLGVIFLALATKLATDK